MNASIASGNNCWLYTGNIGSLDWMIIVCLWTVEQALKLWIVDSLWHQGCIYFGLKLQKKSEDVKQCFLTTPLHCNYSWQNLRIYKYCEFYKWVWLMHVVFRKEIIRSILKIHGTLIKVELHMFLEQE